MIGKWKEALDKGKKVGNLFMDLSKVFVNLNHNLSLTIKSIQSYLPKNFQRVNI